RFALRLDPFTYTQSREFNPFFSTWNTSELKSSSALFSISQPILLTDGTLSLQNQFAWRDSYSEYQDSKSKTFSNNLYVSFDQPLFTYNRTKLALAEVQLDLENALLNYKIRELMLERMVSQRFYSTYQNRMALQVAREDYLNREQSYEIIRNKVDAGLAAQEELYQAELNMATSESEVQNQQVNLDNSLDELKRLIGISVFDEIAVTANITMDSVVVDMQKALDFGIKNRLELRQRDINIEISRANLTRSAAINEFKGNLSLSYGIIGNDEALPDIYKAPTKNQRINIAFDIPLWDWGERESRIKAAEKSIEQNNISLSDEKTNIIIAIRQAYRNIQNQVLQVDLARQNVRTAQLTYDINLERYKNGDLTSMDLNLFQNQLSQKKIGLINAMISYKLHLLDLKIESLWDFEKNEPVFDLESVTYE
ncbi:MAG: TolC family protein, partial [Calditrichales bacterium]